MLWSPNSLYSNTGNTSDVYVSSSIPCGCSGHSLIFSASADTELLHRTGRLRAWVGSQPTCNGRRHLNCATLTMCLRSLLAWSGECRVSRVPSPHSQRKQLTASLSQTPTVSSDFPSSASPHCAPAEQAVSSPGASSHLLLLPPPQPLRRF
jgi:hypothetical protein